jgi:hypothetical protein
MDRFELGSPRPEVKDSAKGDNWGEIKLHACVGKTVDPAKLIEATQKVG